MSLLSPLKGVVVPSTAQLYEGWSQPAWSHQIVAAEAAIVGSKFAQMASVGLAIRLWNPRLGGIPQALENIDQTPPGRARAWIETLTAEQVEEFVLEANALLERLSVHIERLEELERREVLFAANASLAGWIIVLRDRAESVAWILSEMGNGQAFAEQLVMLDESAKPVVLRHLRFDPSEDSTWSHPRWDAAAKEPEAWWAHHVKGFEVY